MSIFSKIKLLVGPPGHEEPAGEFTGGIPRGTLTAAITDHRRRTWANAFKKRQRWPVNPTSQYLEDLGRSS